MNYVYQNKKLADGMKKYNETKRMMIKFYFYGYFVLAFFLIVLIGLILSSFIN